MNELDELLNIYKNEYYAIYSKKHSCDWNVWADQNIAKSYLEKYWLTISEFINKWEQIQQSIFDKSYNIFPDLAFNEDFQLVVLQGGGLLPQEHLLVLISLLKTIKETEIIVIQDVEKEQFRLKFPSSIKLEELMSGNYISTALFEMPYEKYYVYGESQLWGIYYDNESVEAPAIFGFKQEIKETVIQLFKPLKEEINCMYQQLNEEYRQKALLI